MPSLYNALTAALAASGCLSLLVSGELSPSFYVPALAALIAGYYRHLTGRPALSRRIVSALVIAEIALFTGDIIYITDDYLVAVAHLTLAFQAIKSVDFRDPWDHLQVYFMSLLQLIIASELSLSVVFALVFVVFLVVLVMAMVYFHFVKEGAHARVSPMRPVAVITLMTFCLTLVFFVATPRLRSGLWGRKSPRAQQASGFSDNVDIGIFGKVLLDDTVVMVAEVSSPNQQLYWRGPSYDHFDGRAWSDSIRRRTNVNIRDGSYAVLLNPGPRDDRWVTQKIVLEPLNTEVVFGLDDMVELRGSMGWFVNKDYEGSVFSPFKVGRRISYEVLSRPMDVQPRPEYRLKAGPYLQMPPPMRQAIANSAGSVTAGANTDGARAMALERYLRNSYTYSLETQLPPPGMSAIEDFMFRSRRGYCEHFSTAMALMLRALGIPSRVVTGFHGGDETEEGRYVIVRQRDAHSWVEALIDKHWVRFDPTPLAAERQPAMLARISGNIKLLWYRYVIGFSREEQRAIFEAATAPSIDIPNFKGVRVPTGPVYLIVIAALLVWITYMIMRRIAMARRLSRESRVYMAFLTKLRRRGGRVGPSITPREAVAEAVRLGYSAEAASELIALYEEARFGGGRPDEGRYMRVKGAAGRVFR